MTDLLLEAKKIDKPKKVNDKEKKNPEDTKLASK